MSHAWNLPTGNHGSSICSCTIGSIWVWIFCPYNGHTTSLDAFWMGVPTITQIGTTVVGRAGWSQLCNLGLPELAARTPEEFVTIAVQLAGDLPRLQELRATLRARMRASPLMDGKRFAGHMEQAYRQMWRTWCQKEVRP